MGILSGIGRAARKATDAINIKAHKWKEAEDKKRAEEREYRDELKRLEHEERMKSARSVAKAKVREKNRAELTKSRKPPADFGTRGLSNLGLGEGGGNGGGGFDLGLGDSFGAVNPMGSQPRSTRGKKSRKKQRDPFEGLM
jgi:hypothetical protein